MRNTANKDRLKNALLCISESGILRAGLLADDIGGNDIFLFCLSSEKSIPLILNLEPQPDDTIYQYNPNRSQRNMDYRQLHSELEGLAPNLQNCAINICTVKISESINIAALNDIYDGTANAEVKSKIVSTSAIPAKEFKGLVKKSLISFEMAFQEPPSTTKIIDTQNLSSEPETGLG